MLDLNSLSNFDISSFKPGESEPPSFIDPYATINVNLQNSIVALSKLEAGVKQMGAICVHSVKSFSKSSNKKGKDRADRYAKRLCRLIKTIKFLTNVTTYLSKWIEDINKFMGWVVTQIANKIIDIADSIVQYVLGWLEIIVLKIKELILFVKIKIAKFIKKILEGIRNKKGSAASAAIAAAIQGVIVAFQALAQVAYFILLGIDILLKSLPMIIMIDGQNMTFFMTPRTIVAGQMQSSITCANANMSIVDRLPAPLCLALVALYDVSAKANAAIKASMIAAGAAMGIASVFGPEFSIPSSVCKAMQMLDPKNIIKQIDNILKAFAMPYALPKYEELSPITIGYLAFLMTGFCPAGHIAFGFPACP